MDIQLDKWDRKDFNALEKILKGAFTPPRIYKVTSSLVSCEINSTHCTLVFQIHTTVIKGSIPADCFTAIAALTDVKDVERAKLLLSRIKLTQN
jgi:hypothetical protein